MFRVNSIKTDNILWRIVAILIILAAPAIAFAEDEQKIFTTPQQAVEALIAANRSDNQAELLKILGTQADKLIHSGDQVADKEGREKFVAAYNIRHKLKIESDTKEILIVGNNEWPVPIPLVREKGKWRFDTAAGEQEILDRRIGRNELNVIEVCREYILAQREYASHHTLADGKHEYAQSFVSHSGKHNGLYWESAAGEPESPLGPLLAFAQAKGDAKNNKPYHGYYYKILTSQSKNASDGAINYILDGHMTGGFALLSFPTKYGDSGIMTFIVNHNGIVHEKDLGTDTAKIAAQVKQYDPDQSWSLVP